MTAILGFIVLAVLIGIILFIYKVVSDTIDRHLKKHPQNKVDDVIIRLNKMPDRLKRFIKVFAFCAYVVGCFYLLISFY